MQTSEKGIVVLKLLAAKDPRDSVEFVMAGCNASPASSYRLYRIQEIPPCHFFSSISCFQSCVRALKEEYAEWALFVGNCVQCHGQSIHTSLPSRIGCRSLQRVTLSLGPKQIAIVPYHPQGNAVIGSFDRTLRKGLPCLEGGCGPPGVAFQEAVALLLCSCQSTLHLSTRETAGSAPLDGSRPSCARPSLRPSTTFGVNQRPAFFCAARSAAVSECPPSRPTHSYALTWRSAEERSKVANGNGHQGARPVVHRC